MSFVLSTVSSQNLQHWIATNAPASLKRYVQESWANYLSANGGTGKTVYDLETSYLTAAGISGGTLTDRWEKKLGAGVTGRNAHEKGRNFFK